MLGSIRRDYNKSSNSDNLNQYNRFLFFFLIILIWEG